MPVTYQAEFYYTGGREKEELSLTRTLPDGTRDTSPVNLEEIYRLEEQTRDFAWNQSPDLSRQIGEQLFTLLNGDRQTLLRALKEAEGYGEPLQLIVRAEGPDRTYPLNCSITMSSSCLQDYISYAAFRIGVVKGCQNLRIVL